MPILTTDNGLRLDKSNPEFERQAAWQNTPVVICYDVVADAAGAALQTIPTPFGFEILDVKVQCRAANGSGSLILKHGTTAVTDAIACTTDKAIARAGSIDDAQSTIAAGDVLTVTANGASDRGLVTIIGKRL
jgi:hypothetical protein